ncbi:hypothetical protein JG687_00016344 [Phytophthora cactorum]|uniref:Uncharacterized protein n=1 Tax=Phytophthora cactorum TaxID=29920 RepID=A0A8T1TVG7_9STRA|nr:hypothetical protein JG687_00016344 [Phytophthora cactorum]
MQWSRAMNEWTVVLVQASVVVIFNGNDGKGHSVSHVAVHQSKLSVLTSCDGSSLDDPSSRR